MFFQSLELPINLNYPTRFGFPCDMGNLNPFDHIVQDFRCQLRNARVILDSGVDFPPLHGFGKALDLLQHIGVQHLVVDPVGLGTLLPVEVVVHTLINVRRPVQKLLFGHGQRVPAALAVQLPPEKVVPAVVRRAPVCFPDLPHPVKLFPGNDRFVGIVGHNLSFLGDASPLLCFAVDGFRLQAHQGPGVHRIVQDLAHRGRTPCIQIHIPHTAVPREAFIAFLEFVYRRRHDLLSLQFPGYGHVSQAALRHREDPCHHAGGLWIGHKAVFVVGRLAVAIGWLRADKQPLAGPLAFGSADLGGYIPGVHIVQDVLERGDIVVLLGTVEVVGDGNVADALLRKVHLGVVAGHDVVSAQTGQILCDDHVDVSAFDIGNQPLEAGTVKIQAGIAVVHIEIVDRKAVGFAIILQDCPLCSNTDALSALVVVPR